MEYSWSVWYCKCAHESMHDIDSKSAKLLQSLLEALHACIDESSEVTSLLEAVNGAGFQVEMSLDIAVRPKFPSGNDIELLSGGCEYTIEDAALLKSLGIADLNE